MEIIPFVSRLMRCTIIAAILLVSACSSFDKSYHRSVSLEPLQLPGGSVDEAFIDLYPVPAASGSGVLFDKTPLPPGTGLRSAVTAVAFKLDDRHWLRTALSPSTTWSQLLNFWRQQGVTEVSQDLQNATMQTGWFRKAMQPGYEIRYALRFDRGLQFRSSEVRVYNQSRKAGDSVVGAAVPVAISNENHARLMLDEMQAFVNSQPDAATDSFLASTLDLPARVGYVDAPEEPLLSVRLHKDRLYATVEQAASKGNLHLFEGDAAAGILYLQQYDADKKPGFFARLNPASTVGKKPETSYSLKQLADQLDWSDDAVTTLFSDRFKAAANSPAVKAPGVLLVLTSQGQGAHSLRVRDTRGRRLPRDEAQSLLELIRSQLL